MSLTVVTVMLLCINGLVVAVPVNLMPIQTADRHREVVIFYAAYQGSLREVLVSPVVFNQVLVNQGSAYSNETGMFTAPVSGIYQFMSSFQLCRGNFNNDWRLTVNGVFRSFCHAQVSGGDTTLNTCYYMEKLKKGDQVWITQQVGSCAWASSLSKTITFSGVLLASEDMSMVGGRYQSGSSCPLPIMGANMKPTSASAENSSASSAVAVTLLLCALLSS
ncbi:multimerin-2-like [Sphaeramia orbicularis]|uniref:multimerin-2-like n=1 Tax=Sphaeramia orbicularis TaxID=375764 RepID=UPI00117FB016|nr:multimerin-2-like [Sphaeramia orbicularis]